jgi:hypothetical protein
MIREAVLSPAAETDGSMEGFLLTSYPKMGILMSDVDT